jgi:hypothetical protein
LLAAAAAAGAVVYYLSDDKLQLAATAADTAAVDGFYNVIAVAADVILPLSFLALTNRPLPCSVIASTPAVVNVSTPSDGLAFLQNINKT